PRDAARAFPDARRLGSASLPSGRPPQRGCRVGDPGASRWPQALFAVAAVVMVVAPREYFLRSFSEHSFLAQVVSEFLAIAMWWALLVWDERPSRAAMMLFALAGVGTFLTWPVW